MSDDSKALLVLANGTVLEGRSFGHHNKAWGELCFNTAMTGYQEVLSDPSYRQQIVTFSYPMIGNYGVDPAESESERVQAAAVIVKEYVPHYSNFKAKQSLADFLKEHETPGLQAIDTRRLILMLRTEGAQNGAIFPAEKYHPDMLAEVRSLNAMEGLDLASMAGTQQSYEFGEQEGKNFRVAVLDFGVKRSILRLLKENAFAVTVFPARTSFAELKARNFDCYFLSNGPGDPAALGYAIETVRALLREGKPIFGICLGHQLLGLARGHKRFKLKFGHRGVNQPVRQTASKGVEITSQNHGFAIHAHASQKAVIGSAAAQSEDSVSSLQTSHTNLNDNTIEGFVSEEDFLMSVQYHPEASPGPHDSRYLFQNFFQMLTRYYAKNSKTLAS